MNGIKVGRVLQSGPPTCEVCGTEYRLARVTNLPHAAAGVLAVMFLVAWLTDRINIGVFIILCGLWLLLDFLWEYLVPLQKLTGEDQEPDS